MVQPSSNRPSEPAPASPEQQATGAAHWLKILLDLGGTAVKLGQTLVQSATGFGAAAGQQTYQWLEQATHGAGRVVNFLARLPLFQNPVIRKVAGVLRLDWLFGITEGVNLDRVKTKVTRLQQRYPQDSPSQLAHRIMVKKAMDAGGVGFVSSLVPGFAVAFLAVDLATTTALQTEMIYQIAAVYGLDLEQPQRRGEVVAVFGLALGGGNALRAGLGFLRNLPLAGAMIGASTNATMVYSLGYTAQRFYEAKLEAGQEPPPETLEALQRDSEAYLEIAIAQQAVMDQILVHMILARHPEKTWEDILPELQLLQIQPDSLQAIAEHLQAPEPLGALVDQLDCDFAMPLLAQCRRIATQDGPLSSAEAEVLEAITEKCDRQLLAETAADPTDIEPAA